MAAHVDILDQEDSLGRQLLGSTALHVAVAAAVVGWGMWRPAAEPWGTDVAGGTGAVTVTAATIPIPNRSPRLNDVARDTESMAPSRPNRETKAPTPDPDAIAIGKKKRPEPKTKLDMVRMRELRKEQKELADNQLTSATGARASSPLFQVQGTGSIGVGDNATLGTRFGAYVNLIRRCVGEKWREQRVDPNSQVSRPAIVSFTIHRPGQASNINVAQSSGNLGVDRACQRAIEACSPFQPLPNEYDRNTATVEFWFQLQK